MQTSKVKDVAKIVAIKGPRLKELILRTMKTVSDLVGGTLGPGGCPVIIERQELNLPSFVTKDGVTVFRAIGLKDPVAHALMEIARDASVRTANEAGDGTTTATILAEAIVRLTMQFCETNVHESPQKVVRRLEKAMREVIEPQIRQLSLPASLETPEGRELLLNVAKVSANGDTDLAAAVLQCFDISGDAGNVTIEEVNGPSHYETEKIEGYPVSVGYDDCCLRFQSSFVNDVGNQRVYLESPTFIVWHGRITEIHSLLNILDEIGLANDGKIFDEAGQPIKAPSRNVVIVATGFSESVLSALGQFFAHPDAINPYPLLAPQSPIPGGQLAFLEDVAAIAGVDVYNPLEHKLEELHVAHLGPGVSYFEASRFRSNIVSKAPEIDDDGETVNGENDRLIERIGQVEALLKNPASELDRRFLQERLASLSNGIARLKVIGSSNGELKEKRDRAEDAIFAVRGAIKHGGLPAGGWTLMKLAHTLRGTDTILDEVLVPALMEPVYKLLQNVGYNPTESEDILKPIVAAIEGGVSSSNAVVFDALELKHVRAVQKGLLDSTPAVLEAIRNSLSIASLLGTLGGAVVYPRDTELERREAADALDWHKDANVNPADERA